MSNKQRLTPEECQERKNAHLDRTLKELGWEEISQNDYRKLKRDDPVHYHSYTIRVRFKYYKIRPKDNEDKIIEDLKLEIMKSARDYFEECIKKREGEYEGGLR